jgi:hypothetical protein
MSTGGACRTRAPRNSIARLSAREGVKQDVALDDVRRVAARSPPTSKLPAVDGQSARCSRSAAGSADRGVHPETLRKVLKLGAAGHGCCRRAQSEVPFDGGRAPAPGSWRSRFPSIRGRSRARAALRVGAVTGGAPCDGRPCTGAFWIERRIERLRRTDAVGIAAGRRHSW